MMELDYKLLGLRIKMARLRKNYSQEEIANMINVGASHISNIERANTRVSLSTLHKLAQCLDVSMDDIMCDSLPEETAAYNSEMAKITDDCSPEELRFFSNMLVHLKNESRSFLDEKNRKAAGASSPTAF